MGQMTIEQFTDLTDRRFGEIIDGLLDKGPDMVSKFFSEMDSDDETERGGMLTPMGPFQQFTGVGQISYDSPDQSYDWSATHVEYALGVQIQRRLWRFEHFDLIESQWEKLRDSAFHTIQNHAAKIFNEGFDTSSLINFSHTRAEALFADTHATVRDGVSTAAGFDNKGTTALSKAGLNTAMVQAMNLKDDEGNVLGINPTILVVPPALKTQAEELMRSELDPTISATNYTNNAINVFRDKYEVVVWKRLTDTNNWFLLDGSMCKKLLAWFWADRPEFNRVQDFDTIVAKYAGYMQYTMAWKDWRLGIGNEVS